MIGEGARGRSCRRRRRQGSKNIKRKEELYMNHVVSWSEGRKRRHRRRKKKRNRMLKSRHIRIAFLSEAFCSLLLLVLLILGAWESTNCISRAAAAVPWSGRGIRLLVTSLRGSASGKSFGIRIQRRCVDRSSDQHPIRDEPEILDWMGVGERPQTDG